MVFNDVELRRIKQFISSCCKDRTGISLKVWYETRGYEVKIFEHRQSIPGSEERAKTPVARLRFDPQRVEWDLYVAASGQWQKHPDGHAKDLNMLGNQIRKSITGRRSHKV